MGTRSRIGILKENGKIEAVHCQFDGYYEGVGETLKEHYQDKRKLLALMERGGIDALKENPRDCVLRDIENKEFDSIEEYAKRGFDDYEEFLYLYDDKKSEWLGLWNKDKEQKFLPLEEAIQRQKELCFNDRVIVESEKKLKEIIPDYDTLKELYLIDKEVGFSGFANMGDVNGFADFLADLNESSYSLDSVSFPGNREMRAEFFDENRQIFMDFVANEADSLGQSQLEFLEKNLKIELPDLIDGDGVEFKNTIIDAFIYNNALTLTEDFQDRYGTDIEEVMEITKKELELTPEQIEQGFRIDIDDFGNLLLCDKNNNSWELDCLSIAEAIRLSGTLVDCQNCRNCENCRNCKDCYGCEDCKNCGGCSDCQNCQNCVKCEECCGCDDCKECWDCKSCFDCKGCRHCIECEDCEDCEGCITYRNKTNFNTSDEESDNLRTM